MTRSLIVILGFLGLVAAQSGAASCEALVQAGLGDRVILPSDAGYEAEVNSWWAKNGRQRAECFVLPRTSHEVSAVLEILATGACQSDGEIAVRSGGHSSTGSSSTINGITVDLTRLNSTSYDRESNIASVGPGGRWQDVYAELVPHGVTVAGGRDGDVGVGGFLLGGGNSYYSGKLGFGCDTVVNFEVVLANGTIVSANRTANADLWQALKGGSNNFGIVTRFDMDAAPAPKLYRDARFFAANYSDALVDAVVGFADSDESIADDAFFVFFSHDPTDLPGVDTFAASVYVNTQGLTNSRTPFNKVAALPALYNNTAIQTMASAAAESKVRSGTWNYGLTLTFNNDARVARHAVTLHSELVDSLKRIMAPEDFFTQMFLQPLPSYRWPIGKKRGGNVLGLDHLRNSALLYTAGVGVLADDAPRRKADHLLNAMGAQLSDFAKSVGGDMAFIYLNYAGSEQDPLSTYGVSNVKLMKEVAAKYDPAGVFQKRVAGGYKISHVE
ncbi:FAD-binding domain-containing protein [Poronia punctata]|nr:FAD-binding domain-containing protein [Poronia punctata]